MTAFKVVHIDQTFYLILSYLILSFFFASFLTRPLASPHQKTECLTFAQLANIFVLYANFYSMCFMSMLYSSQE